MIHKILVICMACMGCGCGAAAELIPETPKNLPEVPIYTRAFEIHGHSYIYFQEDTPGGLRQILHDPECSCHKHTCDINYNKTAEMILCMKTK